MLDSSVELGGLGDLRWIQPSMDPPSFPGTPLRYRL
jgi:hypothetical protein